MTVGKREQLLLGRTREGRNQSRGAGGREAEVIHRLSQWLSARKCLSSEGHDNLRRHFDHPIVNRVVIKETTNAGEDIGQGQPPHSAGENVNYITSIGIYIQHPVYRPPDTIYTSTIPGYSVKGLQVSIPQKY